MKATIDFEVRSVVDLHSAGASIYSAHPKTTPMCLAAILPGVDTFIIWAPFAPELTAVNYLEEMFKGPVFTGWECPEPLAEWVRDGGTVEAHNAEFEYLIWGLCQRRYGWPELKISQLECSMAKAATCSLPLGLGAAAEVTKTSPKDKRGEYLIQKLCRPRKPTKDDPREFYLDPIHYIELCRYCARDARAEHRMSAAIPCMTPFEKELWRVHLEINLRGMFVDQHLIDMSRKIEKNVVQRLKSELEEATGGFFKAGDTTRIEVFRAKMAQLGHAMDDVRAATVEAMLKAGGLHANAQKALETRQILSKSSVKKFGAFEKRLSEDGRVRGCYCFHGASTGRWAGRGVQPQNLPRGIDKYAGQKDLIKKSIDGVKRGDMEGLAQLPINPMQVLSNCVRAAISAPEGRTIMCSDYAAIEGRGVMWLSNDVQGIRDFADFDAGVGEEPYKVMAGTIYKVKPEDVDKDQRALGKQAILGCGYNMGKDRFLDTCLGYGMDIDIEMAELAVRSYRTRYSAVQSNWYGTEQAAIAAVQKPGRLTKTCGGRVWYKCEGRFLKCKLPSGRVLFYWDPLIEWDRGPRGDLRPKLYYHGMVKNQWTKVGTYGGHLVENITQAVARDIQAFAMMNLRDAGYEVILHTHDEIAVEIDETDATPSHLESYNKLITTTPDWAKGFPVKAEGWIGKNYKKD